MRHHVIFEVDVVTPRAAAMKLNQMHGWAGGVASLDAVPTDEHQEATHALMRTTRLALCMSFDEQGRKRFTILDETEEG